MHKANRCKNRRIDKTPIHAPSSLYWFPRNDVAIASLVLALSLLALLAVATKSFLVEVKPWSPIPDLPAVEKHAVLLWTFISCHLPYIPPWNPRELNEIAFPVSTSNPKSIISWYLYTRASEPWPANQRVGVKPPGQGVENWSVIAVAQTLTDTIQREG